MALDALVVLSWHKHNVWYWYLSLGTPEHAISGKLASTRLMQAVGIASPSIVLWACMSDRLMLHALCFTLWMRWCATWADGLL